MCFLTLSRMFTHMEKSPLPMKGCKNLDISKALTAISIMSHLQDHDFYYLILRRYMAEIFPIRCKTLYNQSIMMSSEGVVTFAPVAER